MSRLANRSPAFSLQPSAFSFQRTCLAVLLTVAVGFAQDRASRVERVDSGLKGVTLRTRIETREGGLVVYDAPTGDRSPAGKSAFVVYWHEASTGKVHVYGRAVNTRSELIRALRWLQHDLGVDPGPMAPRLFADPPELEAMDVEPLGERRMWFEATRDRVMIAAGVWSLDDFDPDAPPEVGLRLPSPCQNCATAGGVLRTIDGSDLNAYEEGVLTACECCEPPPCPNCADNNVCTVDYCNRVCEVVWCVNRGINCDDENACTIDSCHPQYSCQHPSKNCDDDDVCTHDRCNPETGACENIPRCSNRTCCPSGSSYFCCNTGEDQCCPSNPAWANHCCKPDETCCGAGCCPSDKTCCNNVCGLKGACCFFGSGGCAELTGICCQQQGGTYQGDGTACNPPDLCRPQCDNCHAISTTAFECYHLASAPCDTGACIVNLIDTASCDMFEHRLGPEKCNTDTVANETWVVQEVRLLLNQSCSTYWPGDFHVLSWRWYGCGTDCFFDDPIQIRCDTNGCDGPLDYVRSRIPKRVCGCP